VQQYYLSLERIKEGEKKRAKKKNQGQLGCSETKANLEIEKLEVQSTLY
jgi:hypothetical protein